MPLLVARLILIALAAARAAQAPAIAPDVRRAMDDINRALGVECTHCHVEDHWTDAGKEPYAIAKNMIAMVKAVNERLTGVGEVRCWTCHGGQTKPSRLPRERLDEELLKWPAGLGDDRKVAMTVYNVTLGVECDHCHTPGDWKDAAKKPMKTVARMTSLFDLFPKYVPATARTQCFMCHKGSTKPQVMPPKNPD
jgi:hypothetical protein